MIDSGPKGECREHTLPNMAQVSRSALQVVESDSDLGIVADRKSQIVVAGIYRVRTDPQGPQIQSILEMTFHNSDIDLPTGWR